jgi:hypothetical protein
LLLLLLLAVLVLLLQRVVAQSMCVRQCLRVCGSTAARCGGAVCNPTSPTTATRHYHTTIRAATTTTTTTNTMFRVCRARLQHGGSCYTVAQLVVMLLW